MSDFDDANNAIRDDIFSSLNNVEKKQGALQDLQMDWDKFYDKFILEVEPAESPPGGGRWNDKNRIAWCRGHAEGLYNDLQDAKTAMSLANAELKAAYARERHLERTIRWLSLQ